jgi:ubiquinone/menaquinone biosynthesis C-methylase UbiE
MVNIVSDAEAFYDQHALEEWERFERHRTEFAVTHKALEDFLPPPPASIIDIGCGPGRYAIELARTGYTVTLLDVSSKSLQFAQKKAKQAGVSFREMIHANAMNLDQCKTGSFDAVLLMGPLYHLLLKEERMQAVEEAARLLKPGGRFFAAVVTRFAPIRGSASKAPEWVVDDPKYAEQMLESGLHDEPKNWAKAYLMHPDEVTPLMEGCGLRSLLLVGCEGIVAGHEDKINELQGEEWQIWVDLNYRLGKEPSLYGASTHLLYVGEKL